jgi:hypothetical protein
MALGKVEIINLPDRTSGFVSVDDAEETYPFTDVNFPNTGLQEGDACTFDIDFTQRQPVATNLQKVVPLPRIINSAVSGDINMAVGETITVVRNGSVTGNIVVNSGRLIIENTGQVTGDVTLNNGGDLVVRKGGILKGHVGSIKGGVLKVVGNGSIINTIITLDNCNRVVIGNNNGPGKIEGEIKIKKIRRFSVTQDSSVNC